jgi:hypothetical protein
MQITKSRFLPVAAGRKSIAEICSYPIDKTGVYTLGSRVFRSHPSNFYKDRRGAYLIARPRDVTAVTEFRFFPAPRATKSAARLTCRRDDRILKNRGCR